MAERHTRNECCFTVEITERSYDLAFLRVLQVKNLETVKFLIL